MKKIFVIKLILIALVSMATVVLYNSYDNIGAKVRNVNLKNDYCSNYVDVLNSFEDSSINMNGTDACFRGSKKIESSLLDTVEPICYGDSYGESYDIDYMVLFNIKTGLFTLTAEFADQIDEKIIDQLCGESFINSNGEIDAAFDCNEETVTFSQVRNSNKINDCSAQKMINTSSKLTAVSNASVEVVSNCADASIAMVYSIASDVEENIEYDGYCNCLQQAIADFNLMENKARSLKSDVNSKGYITNQAYYTDWDYVCTKLKDTGCEIIATYNLMVALRKKERLCNVIYEFEKLNIDIGILFGRLGSYPSRIGRYLSSKKVGYLYYESLNSLEEQANKLKECKIIFSTWTGETLFEIHQIHTFYIEKIDGKYYSYNKWSGMTNATSLEQLNYYSFICAYLMP